MRVRRPPARWTAAVLPAALALAACTGGGGNGEQARLAAAAAAGGQFLEAWGALDVERAATLTDDPEAARALLEETVQTLRITAAALEPGEPRAGAPTSPATAAPTPAATPAPEGIATVPYRATLTLATLGEWTYDGALAVRPDGEGWLVDFSAATVHPQLSAATRLSRVRELPPRAPVLDRQGRPLMQERPVVEVGVEPRRMREPERTYAVAADVLDVDADALRERVAAADPGVFLPVVTLREADFARVEERVRAVPGFLTREGVRTLAPTPSFGRALLGTVRPATAETLEDAGPLASEVDEVGSSGLQRAFEPRLAGSPGGAVRLLDRQEQRVVATLHEFPARPGTPLQTTLDLDAQAAAEEVLAASGRGGAVVAVRPATGEILAAASGPAEDGQERALAGRYPPGSTFKVVTTAELLAGGLTPADVVPCPAEASVGGRTFTNAGDLALGPVPFRVDFARSCNTAFVGLSRDLGPEALQRRAAELGVGVAADLPVPFFAGSVPRVEDPVARAAAAIGQGEVLASPLAMAMVAATVQAGGYRAPVLLGGADPPSPADPPAALDPGIADTLRQLMRAVVTEGSATVLDLPGEPVAAKTGTAEYGTDVPPRTHAWVVGYRGVGPEALAFAVLLEDGGSGGRDAAPVAREFLAALDSAASG